MSAATGSLVSRIYKGFRGVDFRSDETNFARSPDSLNVWRDYKEIDSIRTRPGLELKASFDGRVYGLFAHGDYVFVHCGSSLYKVLGGEKTLVYTGVTHPDIGVFFVFNDELYFLDGYEKYLVYKNGLFEDVKPYVPTTSIGRKPSGGGTTHEDVNMLTGERINTFVADGESRTFVLDKKGILEDYLPKVFVNNLEVKDCFTVDYAAGTVTFNDDVDPPPAPLTDGQDNVSIMFCVYNGHNFENIVTCKLVQVFDNRVFFAGGRKGSTIWHSSLNDPTYVSDLDYYNVGLDRGAVKNLVVGNNALWVLCDTYGTGTSVFYYTPAIDSQYGKIYPSSHSDITVDCFARAINFKGDIVFFSRNGMEGFDGDTTTNQKVFHRSSLIDRKLVPEPFSYDYWDYSEDMSLVECQGYLFLFINKEVYLADSRAKFTNVDHLEYEWFYWGLGKFVCSACVDYNGVLYIGTRDGGLYTLTDMDAPVESYWVTPKDRFGAAHKLKTTNKRGCVAEATGDITVYAKVEDTEFEKIGEYKDVQDYFVSRIKRKKFKDLQLKFHSNTRFSLESATLESWVGGYIKR